ncbi:MAG: 50S ribosomal protein L13 [Acidobacteriota bacterium]
MKTYSPKRDEIERRWYVVDAAGLTLGRLSTEIARVLRGKHKPTFVPHLDTGDFVVVVNAEQIVLTGNKESQKLYRRHSGRPGGLREMTAAEMRQKHPTRLIEKAVKGMLPKGPLGRKQLKKLRVYAGTEHPHVAQQPEPLALEQARRG